MADRELTENTLRSLIQSDGPFTGRRLDTFALDLLAGLDEIHQSGQVHGGLEPRAVVCGTGRPAISRRVRARPAAPGYLAPELIMGESPGWYTDMFAWACVVTFAATGHSPFGADDPATVFHRILVGEPDLSGLPGHLREVAAQCLTSAPGKRPRAAVAQQLVVAGSPPATTQRAEPVAAPSRKRRRAIAAVIVGTAVVATSAWVILRAGDQSAAPQPPPDQSVTIEPPPSDDPIGCPRYDRIFLISGQDAPAGQVTVAIETCPNRLLGEVSTTDQLSGNGWGVCATVHGVSTDGNTVGSELLSSGNSESHAVDVTALDGATFDTMTMTVGNCRGDPDVEWSGQEVSTVPLS